ncbi:MAG TPA: hypothetical protein VJW95_08025, partial [Dissulfurispiraceae bacterium]|nr:hypothetical protein [Dissulfurispiraceae bacterium]
SQAFSETLFSNMIAHSGTQSAAVNFTPDANDAWGESGGIEAWPTGIAKGGQVWARGYFYFQSPWSWICSPVVKIFRIHLQDSSGNNAGYVSLFADSTGAIVLSNEPDTYQSNDPGPGQQSAIVVPAAYDINAWQCLELYVYFSPVEGSAVVRAWKNGVLIFQDTWRATMAAATDTSDESLVFTYWNGGVPQNQTAFVDDFEWTSVQPANTDAQGNYMIGPMATVTPSAPTNLTAQ